MIGIVLLVIGIAGLAVGTVQYTRTKHVLKVGSIDVQAKDKERFTIPPLAAGGVAAVGLVLIVAGRKK
jgi:uncharacterized membrane protein YidH (DUF202 family)